jgi:hypothetical protein
MTPGSGVVNGITVTIATTTTTFAAGGRDKVSEACTGRESL